jgi:hypothetical protein
MDFIIMAKIEQVVRANLGGAQVIALVPNPREDIEREGYWERSWIVTWQRPVRDGQPSLDGDGFTYATHRVHINSNGDSSCFIGNYDQKRNDALIDMLERAGIGQTAEIERLRGEWRKADDGWIAAKEEIDRLHRDLALSVCYSPQAIKDSFDGADEDHPDAKWAREASDEQLLEVANMIVNSDPTWKDFHSNIEMCIEEMRNKKE